MTECVMVVSATGGYRESSKELTTPGMLTNNWKSALVHCQPITLCFESSAVAMPVSSDINHLTKNMDTWTF